jgi:hypothetical protein
MTGRDRKSDYFEDFAEIPGIISREGDSVNFEIPTASHLNPAPVLAYS